MSFFEEAYRGIPPWDIGRPQAEFVHAADRGEVRGDVLDAGCGTGENSIFFASRGHPVLGVDSAPLAIKKAKSKAKQRNSRAEFKVWDALDLGSLRRKFDTVIDSGLFHVFPDSERTAYVKSVSSVLRKEGRFLMLCFSDEEPTDWGGPRRVSKAEIGEAFSDGWRVDYIKRAWFESQFSPQGSHAWLSSITKDR